MLPRVFFFRCSTANDIDVVTSNAAEDNDVYDHVRLFHRSADPRIGDRWSEARESQGEWNPIQGSRL